MTMALVSILLVFLCAAELHGQSIDSTPPQFSHDLLDFLNHARGLFPDAVTLEELLNMMAIFPTMDEPSLTTLLRGANIDMTDPSQISNVLVVLKGLYTLTTWGYSKLPNGDINDLYIMLSNMDEQNLELLLRNLNIDQINTSQYADGLIFLQGLKASLTDAQGTSKPPSGDITELLKMISALDEKSLKLLLQGLNIDGSALSFLQVALSGGNLDFLDLSPGCSADLNVLVSNVKEQKMWALKIIDAWGKPPPGILTGNSHWMGSFDQCLAVQPETEEGTPYASTFCVAGDINPASGMSVGMCVPKVCTESDVYNITKAIFDMIPLNGLPNISHIHCEKEIEYDTRAYAAISVCCSFLAIILVATVFDMFIVSPEIAKSVKTPVAEEQGDVKNTKKDFYHISSNENGNSLHHEDVECSKNAHIQTHDIKPGLVYKLNDNTAKPNNDMAQKYSGICSKLLLSFSAWTNGRKLLSTEQAGTSLGSINGIRFFSVIWIILGHTVSYSIMTSAVANRESFFTERFNRESFMLVNNAYMPVDSFFTLSGILVSYMFMKEMKRGKGRINWFMFYFHRFFRLTPTYMIVLMLNVALFHYVTDGVKGLPAYWNPQVCEKLWWHNLLYVNNFFGDMDRCMSWSWYLACDMQFYIISPLLLVPLYYWKKIGGVVCAICLLGTTVCAAIISVHFQLPAVPISSFSRTEPKDYVVEYYIKPYCRMGPYIMGILTGFILYRTGGKCKIKMPLNLFIWACMTSLACVIVFGTYEETIGNVMSVEVAALYNAVQHTLWGVCISWVVFACVTGNGGYVNTFLSWSLFVPLGRLTYSVYLIHPLVLAAYFCSQRQGIYGTDINLSYIYIGNLAFTYMVAVVLSLGVESPLMALEKTILRKDKKSN